MPLFINYSTSSTPPTGGTNYKNLYIAGNTDQSSQGYGPSRTTRWYMGINPPEGGYAWYRYDTGSGVFDFANISSTSGGKPNRDDGISIAPAGANPDITEINVGEDVASASLSEIRELGYGRIDLLQTATNARGTYTITAAELVNAVPKNYTRLTVQPSATGGTYTTGGGGGTFAISKIEEPKQNIWLANDNDQLIEYYNKEQGTNHTTFDQVVDEIEEDNEQWLTGLVTRSGLICNIDFGNENSYPGTGTDVTNLVTSGPDAELRDGPTYSNRVMQFDGSNDKIVFDENFTLTPSTGFTFWVLWDLPAQSSTLWNYFLFKDQPNSHRYEFGQYGQAADRFHFKDNISFAGTAQFANMASTGYSSFAFGTTSNGYSYNAVNGGTKSILNPGSNSYWATPTVYNLVFNQLFQDNGSALAANVKKLCIYNRELSQEEIEYNHEFAASYRL